MFGPSYAGGCPVNSSIAEAFDSLIPHLNARNVSFIAVSERRSRSSWGIASGWGGASPGPSVIRAISIATLPFRAASTRCERRSSRYSTTCPRCVSQRQEGRIYGYMTELFGFTTFALEDGTVHQTYSTTGRGVEFLMPYYGSSTVLRTAAMRARAGNCGSAATTSTAASDWGRPYAPLAPRHTGRTNPDGQGWATENSFGWQLGAHVPRWLAAVRPCPRNVRASVPSCRNGFRSHLALAAWRKKGRQPTSPSRAQLAGCNTTSAGDP